MEKKFIEKCYSWLKINLLLIVLLNNGCSEDDKENIITSNITIRTGIGDTLSIHSHLDFNLVLDKTIYKSGDTVKVYFGVKGPLVFDHSFDVMLLFNTNEKFGMEVYKDTNLVFASPITKTFITDTLFFSYYSTLWFSYYWLQINFDSTKIEPGTYKVKAFLLHEFYSQFIKEKYFRVYNDKYISIEEL